MSSSLALQLYSIRREMSADSIGTFKRVPTFGYGRIELAGTYGWSADQWLKLLQETGLQIAGAHLGLPALEGNWGPETLFQRTLGNQWLIVPSLPKELQTTDGYRQAAQRLNALGRRAQQEGFRFGYHNHAFEFTTLPEGGCGMDILLAETDPALVAFEVDTYWVERGGRDARQFIELNAARIGLVHAKELRKRDGADVPAGQGNVDFKAIVPLARERGWQVVVEFEGEGAVAAVTESARYLQGL
jgi:sugar phosphate isomerase/epimerase